MVLPIFIKEKSRLLSNVFFFFPPPAIIALHIYVVSQLAKEQAHLPSSRLQSPIFSLPSIYTSPAS